MSCHTTPGGLLVLRLARAYSGLSEGRLQELFHELKREARNFPPSAVVDLSKWQARQLTLIKHAPMSFAQKIRSESDLLSAVQNPIDPQTFYALRCLEVRSRAETVFTTITSPIANLDLPGSQANRYVLGEDGRPARVWYASYGSNLSKSRFMSYINGTVPEGLITAQVGTRDHAEPIDDRAICFTGRMHFAGSSSRWGGGGMSFIDSDPVAKTLGRAYQITAEQFDDIIAQENRKEVGSLTVNTAELLAEGKLSIDGTSIYGAISYIGDLDGSPVFTVTGNFDAQESIEHANQVEVYSQIATNKPNYNYLRTIGLGLQETFGMDTKQQADYLRGAPGAEDITRTEMVRILSTPIENRQQRIARIQAENVTELESIAGARENIRLLRLRPTIRTQTQEEEISDAEAHLFAREQRVTERAQWVADQTTISEEPK